MFRILLAESLDSAAEARLAAAAEIVRPEKPGADGLRAAIAGCDALIGRTHTPVSRDLLAAGDRLRAVGVAGVGVERVDEAAASELGIAILNTPGAASDAVAELTVALMLQLLRPIPRLAASYRAGEYRQARAEPHGGELRERTVGIIGMGRIGSRVGRICAAGFGCRVLYNDILHVGPFDFPAAAVEKPQIWSETDVVTLHVPLTSETSGLLNADVLSAMRQETFLINTSRGRVVETAALTEALADGRIAGAALDVTEPEPLPTGHALFNMSQCILTPHVAARTHGGLSRMYGVVDLVIEYLHKNVEGTVSHSTPATNEHDRTRR